MQVKILTYLIVLFMVFGCGRNMLSDFEKDDPAEQAAIDLENKKPDKVILDLEKELSNNSPDNAQYLSILSAAYAQRAGVDFLDIALKIIDTNNSTVNLDNQNTLVFLWDVLGEMSESNHEDIKHAIRLLLQIEETKRTRADLFKLSLLYVIDTSLMVKQIDIDFDGSITEAELEAIPDELVDRVLNNLQSAEVAAALSKVGIDAGSQETAEQIQKIYDDIQNQEGSTNKEKLVNYLKRKLN